MKPSMFTTTCIKGNKLIALHTEETFPQALIEHDIDIVFDLAESISKSAISISSALKMADYVVAPIYNEYKSLVAGLNTINQIKEHNQKIIVVAIKFQKQKGGYFQRRLDAKLGFFEYLKWG